MRTSFSFKKLSDQPQTTQSQMRIINNTCSAAITTAAAAAASEKDMKLLQQHQQQQQQKQLLHFNTTGKGLCYIHVGKTGGASFRTQYADAKETEHPLSLPQLKFWKEYHSPGNHDWLNNDWYEECDYFVAWVRDPIGRLISGYNSRFDPEIKPEPELQDLVKNTYGNLNGLAESLFLQDGTYNENAGNILERFKHIRRNIGWFFHSDPSGSSLQQPVLETRMMYDYHADSDHNNNKNTNSRREISTGRTIVSRLSNREFLSKLVFVGSNECYSDDVQRFEKMFGIDPDFTSKHPMEHVHTSTKRLNNEYITNLSELAIQNLRRYLSVDYDVISSLIQDHNLIHCPKLIEKVLCEE